MKDAAVEAAGPGRLAGQLGVPGGGFLLAQVEEVDRGGLMGRDVGGVQLQHMPPGLQGGGAIRSEGLGEKPPQLHILGQGFGGELQVRRGRLVQVHAAELASQSGVGVRVAGRLHKAPPPGLERAGAIARILQRLASRHPVARPRLRFGQTVQR